MLASALTGNSMIITVVRAWWIGLAVGVFWLTMSLLFFTAPESPVVDLAKVIAAITCPPLLVAGPLLATVLNGLAYACGAYLWRRGRRMTSM